MRAPALFTSLSHYERRWLRGDVIAGLTVWAALVKRIVRIEIHTYPTVQDAVTAAALHPTIDEVVKS